jgi:hypothetical protein
MAGKNKIERGFRLLWDDLGTGAGTARDLSGDLVPGSVSGGGLVFDEVEMTGVSESVKNFLAGHASAEVSARFHLNDTATTGAFTVLTGSDGGYGTLTLQWGSSGAAPTTGDPEWEGEYVLLNCRAVMDGGRAVMEARWLPQGSTAPAWGTVA